MKGTEKDLTRNSQPAAELSLDGRPVSRGVAIGKVVCLYGENRQYFRTEIIKESIPNEIDRFRIAHDLACRRLRKVSGSNGARSNTSFSIFDLHRAILEDSTLKERIESVIENDLVNAEWAVKVVTDEYIAKYRAIPDEHFRDRYIDVEDIADQLQSALGGGKHPIRLAEDSIITAKELRPSTLAELSVRHPKAVITETGGWTSHTFILARELEIPAVTGIKKLMRKLKPGDVVVIDGYQGKVILNPGQKTLEKYRVRAARFYESNQAVDIPSNDPIKTLDGREITIRANFDIPSSFQRAKRLGAKGIGLYRSEYLFNRFKGYPTESEQLKAYSEIAENAGPERARIRTFDIGIDQMIDSSGRKEKNPALGLRAVRLSLAIPRHLRTQIRALLQASYRRNIDIILPMVSGPDELRSVREVIERESALLNARNVPIGSPRLGAMIEVPAAVFTIDKILEEVDCLCLGTNDLVQYLLAVDRDNESVAGWFRTLHPAVMTSLKIVIDAANKAEKPLVVCGEMAGSPFYVPILIGLGATELSMNVNTIMRVRRVISGIAYEETKELIDLIMKSKTADEVEDSVERFVGGHWSHLLSGETLLGRKR
ncbi:MAG: phosphoenolpyruvate--protein phosphotransferase [Pyrinomonadaceae bacterium]|nr:phosphoenolpyruvate--protein phosphotransferase [Blastocatellia bacterium]MCW5957578.1 phosphoenolpyruvate--protein phosphotransferase [Pyrinomonadaceae bacterium]